MAEWKNVTDSFSEDARYYCNTYLEICEVINDELEVSLFSSKEKPYEIYISYDILYGIIYTNEKDAMLKYEEVKEELQKEYAINKKVTDEFINSFCKTHNVCLPGNTLFDFHID